jgi:hypothetical protein
MKGLGIGGNVLQMQDKRSTFNPQKSIEQRKIKMRERVQRKEQSKKKINKKNVFTG